MVGLGDEQDSDTETVGVKVEVAGDAIGVAA